MMRSRLGRSRWRAVRSWCEEFGRASPDAVLLHGAFSTGSLVVSQDFGQAALLTGEDVAYGSAEFDVGWLLGEFLELRLHAARQSSVKPSFADLPAAFLEGYGITTDARSSGRAAVLRMLVHLHDFAAYVGWHPELSELLWAVPDYIDTDGHAAVNLTL